MWKAVETEARKVRMTEVERKNNESKEGSRRIEDLG